MDDAASPWYFSAMEAAPRFFLYGEPEEEEAEARFLHLESIPARARPLGWRIAPHRHAGLLQLMLVSGGGGRMQVDGAEQDFSAPMLILMPPGIVHGYAFAPGTEGWVLTVAETLAAEAAPDALPGEPLALALTREALRAHVLEARFAELMRELQGSAPGRAAAMEALLRLLLIALFRLHAEHRLEGIAAGPEIALFARFRALVERHYREHRPIGDYLRELGVPEKRLAAACRRIAGRTPAQVIRHRLATEARRCLLYTSASVSEIGFGLGFRDPAYFSRFCRRLLGAPPGISRRSATSAPPRTPPGRRRSAG
jgi:AraC family transcriptional activator of pobA